MLTALTSLLIGAWFGLLILVSMAGNSLVCLAIYKDSRLRRTENLFLASLAVADLLVAVLVMTFAAVNDLLGYWVFGPMFCDTWIAVDIMCSTASILNLCAISLDRYIHIKDPFWYSYIVTQKTAVSSITIIWAVSAVISILPIYFDLHRASPNPVPTRDPHHATCALDLSPQYAMVSSFVSFYLPCLVMISIYCRLYFFSRRHWQMISQLNPSHSPTRDYKAAITVGVIMGIFLVCWLPFFCANIIASFCKTCVSDVTFKVFTWLGYSNSMFNPIVYSILNSDFRDSFKLILKRKLSNELSLSSSHN